MSEELRPCPFCGGKNVLSTELQDGLPFIAYCQCGAENEAENWNTRPIEDELHTRIAELEMKIRHNALWQASEDAEERAHLEKLVPDLKKRIAELEEQVWNLNLENERLEEAYFVDETIAPDGTLKPSVRKLLERLEKAETDLRLSDDLVKALDNRIAGLNECVGSKMADVYTLKSRIAKLEAAQRWRVVANGELPKYNDYYWAHDDLGQQGMILFYDGEWNKFTNLSYITHWMPLPQPPEERER